MKRQEESLAQAASVKTEDVLTHPQRGDPPTSADSQTGSKRWGLGWGWWGSGLGLPPLNGGEVVDRLMASCKLRDTQVSQ